MTIPASFARSGRAASFIASLFVLALLPLAAACGGGGDDIKNIQSTATAAAKNRPSPTATPDAVAAYRQKVTTSGKKLSDATNKAVADMLTASENQADPKWPGIMIADADAITLLTADLKGLAAPGDTYREFAKNLDAAVAQVEKGAQTLKQAATQASADLGTQAFVALSEGKDKLTAALAALPAQ